MVPCRAGAGRGSSHVASVVGVNSARSSESLIGSPKQTRAPTVVAAAPAPVALPARAGEAPQFEVRLRRASSLHRAGAEKDTRHVVLKTVDRNVTYAAGDSLAVIARNCPDLVGAIIERLAAQPCGHRPQLPRPRRRDHRAAGSAGRYAGSIAGRHRMSARRGTQPALRDSPAIRPSDRGPRLAGDQPRGVARAPGDGRRLSRRGAAGCRSSRPARHLSIGAATRSGAGRGPRSAATAPLFDRLVAKEGIG